MSSLNKVLLIGNVGSVEVKNLTNGNKLVQMSLATSDGYKKADGSWENKTEWHRLIFAIPALADRASTVGKGDVLYVEGSISTNEWTTKEGEKKSMKEISCTSFKTFAKAKSGDASPSNGGKASPGEPANSPQQSTGEADDDLPF